MSETIITDKQMKSKWGIEEYPHVIDGIFDSMDESCTFVVYMDSETRNWTKSYNLLKKRIKVATKLGGYKHKIDVYKLTRNKGYYFDAELSVGRMRLTHKEVVTTYYLEDASGQEFLRDEHGNWQIRFGESLESVHQDERLEEEFQEIMKPKQRIKKYDEWFGYYDEELERVGVHLNTLDLLSAMKDCGELELWDIMDQLNEKFEYKSKRSTLLFDYVTEEELVYYLKNRYPDEIIFSIFHDRDGEECYNIKYKEE